MTWRVVYSETALALYGAALWGRWIADTSPNPNHATLGEVFIALFGGLILAWLPRAWHSVLVIPTGYAIGMLFVAVGPWGKLDITFIESLLLILLTITGSAAGTFIIQIRQKDHQTS